MQIVVFLILFVASTQSARILGIIPTASFSHQIVFRPLWTKLSLRGHDLTVVTTHPLNNSSLINIKEINLSATHTIWNQFTTLQLAKMNIYKKFRSILKLTTDVADYQLQHPEIRALIENEEEHFDLLMVESSLPAMVAFSVRFKCPMVLMSSFDVPVILHDFMGNPTHPALYPDYTIPFIGRFSFAERLTSTVISLLIKHYCLNWIYPAQQQLIYKYFGDDYPTLQEISKNISMVFVNNEPTLHQVRPLVPAFVRIGGGTHLKLPKQLQKDLQEKLNNATQGFIYFSLGSNVNSSQLPNATLSAIFQTFAELPYLVVCKFDLEKPPLKSDNLVVSKWFPQQDLLGHPNAKLFITQGGLQSIEESVYNHIPLIGMPISGDQPTNVKRIVHKGLGLSVDYKAIRKEHFKATIIEVISNPKYRSSAKILAQLAKDQHMTGLQQAVWWTEYVLRHHGARHLVSEAVGITPYEYYVLDVLWWLLLALFVVILVKAVRKPIFEYITVKCFY